MKHEEAMEYMNRYLDHDLSEEETEALFRHLGDSPEAREDFEFLKRLSDKMESLPDVAPPVSLVDSILPRLDTIDRLAASEAREEPAQVAEMESDRPQPGGISRRRERRFWNTALGRTAGGTAIAAAVLGIFVATYEPKEMPNAEVAPSAAVTGAADDTLIPSDKDHSTLQEQPAESGSTADTAQPEDQLVPDSTEDSGVMAQRIAPEDRPASDSPSDSATPDSSGGGATEKQIEPGGGSADRPAAGTEEQDRKGGAASDSGGKSSPPAAESQPSASAPDKQTKQGTESSDAKAPQTPAAPSDSQQKKANPGDKGGKTSDKPAAATETENNSEKNGGASGTTESVEPDDSAGEGDVSTFSIQQDAPEGDNSSTGSTPPDSQTKTPADNQKPADSKIYSMTAPTALATEWNSPDGTYTISYSGNMLKLNQIAADGSKPISTRKVDGSVSGGVWSADGKTFTYDLLKTDGSTAQETWTIEEVKLESGKK
ncbi:hypothetical protein QWJ34_05140 [Saccharibacillus sp. CPCC 101409]|uniref:hypothetical protein n=1 Tax=Saccharibacillus sp. CPCC 101409 TaxID=3058041 RepID=UPI0026720CE2|nr:hypothetical protein [Saccharibacillus sp. CPCC 101409]MDO3409140.1 hypothetical protein [Saccharibacillus sp. CPCC 101409]